MAGGFVRTARPKRLIRVGFWIGVGMIVPLLLTQLVAAFFLLRSANWFWPTAEDTEEMMGNIMENVGAQIKIDHYREIRKENQVLIVGSITNGGDTKIGSLTLEAELFNAAGEFVYECSEYIGNELAAGQQENFQITCGCGKEVLAEYKTLTVRVAEASAY
jgi:hypothetical protein